MVNHLVYWQRRVNQYKLFLSKVLKYRLNTLVWHCYFYYNKGHVVQFSMHNRWFVLIRDVRCLLSGMVGARKPEKFNSEVDKFKKCDCKSHLRNKATWNDPGDAF